MQRDGRRREAEHPATADRPHDPAATAAYPSAPGYRPQPYVAPPTSPTPRSPAAAPPAAGHPAAPPAASSPVTRAYATQPYEAGRSAGAGAAPGGPSAGPVTNAYGYPAAGPSPSGHAPGYAASGYPTSGHPQQPAYADPRYQPPAGAAPDYPHAVGMDDGGHPNLPMRGRHATPWGQGFGRVVGWTLAGSAVPGSGLIAAGRRVLGGVILGVCVLALLAGVAVALLGDPITLVSSVFLSHPERITYAAGAIVLLGVLWAVQLLATHVSLRRFAELTAVQSTLSWLLVLVLASTGVGAAVYSGKEVLFGRDTVGSIFSGDRSGLSAGTRGAKVGAGDPWADIPRINVLLVGSDAGADRTGIRTDSLIVASINTKTGDTVLFSLPRNLEHVPFPAGTQQAADYPNGFACADHACMINALWQFGMEHKDTYYKGEKNPGLTATVQGVEQVLGLQIDDYAMLDLRGFMQFVDAIGGVVVNVPRLIPVGGHRNAAGVQEGVTSYIKPGRRRLNGYQALWFARSRSDSDDFDRMRRQRCVIGAVTQQADPQTVALHLPQIMQAAKDNIRTSISTSAIDAWVTLTMRVKKSKVRSLPFTNAVINSGDPDFDKIHGLVQKALDPPVPAATAAPTTSAGASAAPSTGTNKPAASPSPTHDPNEAVDVNEVC